MAAPLCKIVWLSPSAKTYTTIPTRYKKVFLARAFSLQPNSEREKASENGISQSSNASSSILTNINNGRLSHFMQMYEDFVGLTEVKLAQAKVVDAEDQFLEVQENRRAMQQDLVGVQTEVRSVGNELEKTHRTDPSYIDLVKKEHEILLVEKDMTGKIKTLDKAERDFFSLLSAAVRESHEKERARAERTKYWSVIGSVIGALIGITGSTWNNRVRLKEMRAIVTESKDTASEYKEVATKLLSSFSFLQNVAVDDSPLNMDRNANNSQGLELEGGRPRDTLQHIQEQTESITKSMNEQTSVILSNFNDLKKILCVNNGQLDNDSVIYVGPEMRQLLDETKADLRNDYRKNVISISVLGCFLTVGVSVLLGFLKGS